MTVTDQAKQVVTLAAQAAAEKKAENIIAIDVSDVLAITDVFLIASADNERQVRAICEEIEDTLTEAGMEPRRREGNREFRWVLLDYGSAVIHIQREQEREFYGLDRLYRDCPALEIEGIPEAERPGDFLDDARSARSLEDLPLAATNPDDDDEW